MNPSETAVSESINCLLGEAVKALSLDKALGPDSRLALAVLAKCLEVMEDCDTLIAVQEEAGRGVSSGGDV